MLKSKGMCIAVLVAIGLVVLAVCALALGPGISDGFLWTLTWIFVAWTTMVCSMIASLWRTARLRWMMRAGIASSIGAMLIVICGEGFRVFDWSWASLAIGPLFIFSLFCCHVAVLLSRDVRDQWTRSFRRLTVAMSGLLSLVWLAVWANSEWFHFDNSEMTIPVVLMTALAGGMSLAVPVLVRLEEITAPPMLESFEPTLVQIICPRCGAGQQIRAGGDRCAECSLVLDLKLADSRCDCGYLIVGPREGKCPECGRMIPRIISQVPV